MRFGYTGQQNLSGLGVQYYKARMYSADLGRFIQTDPIGMADDMNLYAYVGNNAVNARDPSGLCPNCIGAIYGAIAGGVGGGITGYATNNDYLQALEGFGLGAVAGAGIGWIAPPTSYSAGVAAAAANIARTAAIGATSSTFGQFAGNAVNGRPIDTNFNWGAVGGSTIAGPLGLVPVRALGNVAGSLAATSIPIGSSSLSIVTPAVQITARGTGAVTDGIIGGLFEAAGSTMYTPRTTSTAGFVPVRSFK